MTVSAEAFLQRIVVEESGTLEGGIAKSLLRWREKEPSFQEYEEVFQEYREFLQEQLDAVSSLQSQFLREACEAHRKEGA